ncbi:sensor histidine kinase [Zoogloea sp.]|uniref:sensor histidine kinase n=1 Tax=Zoogloea sp. TaxID=49181 RepID=UPI002626A77C|nr:ATP-binding protein [uncultured Zoogloea sp.]
MSTFPVSPDTPASTAPGPQPGRRRLFLPIVSLTLLVLGLLWAAVLLKAQAEEEVVIRSINIETLNLARAFEEHSVRTIKSVDQTVLFLKHQYERYGDKVDIAEYVREGMIISGFFNQLGVIDENGIYIKSNLPTHKRMDLSDREHFRVHREVDSGQLFVSKPVLGRASGKWSIQMTRRINKPDGSFGGVVVISVDPFYFSDFYRGVDLGRGGVVSLVGADGIVRARRVGDDDAVGQDLSSSQLMKQMAQAPSGSYRSVSTADGVTRFYSYRTLKEYPLTVAVGVEETEALAPFVARRRGYLIYVLGVSLVVVFFGAYSVYLLDRQYRISQDLRESQWRAESANRMKSAFLASMSHELRTPLNGIMGYAELLRESSEGENREFAGIVHESSQHLLELVNSILDLARIESGKMTLQASSEALQPLFERIVRTYYPPAAGKGVRLVLSFDEGLPDTLVCDPTRVAQIFNNLLSNAIKFTDAGEVVLQVARRGAQLEVAVRDTGCGIPAEMLPHVFERFRQVDNFLTRRHQGTGLGLALVHELVGLMGGEVRVSSEEGKGSEFVVTLPIDGVPATPA